MSDRVSCGVGEWCCWIYVGIGGVEMELEKWVVECRLRVFDRKFG